jgi:putative molybdopterin biosynthesis protein
MGEELLTVDEAAAVLKLKPWTIRHWVSDRRIPYVKLGSAVRFLRSDLDHFIKKNREAMNVRSSQAQS